MSSISPAAPPIHTSADKLTYEVALKTQKLRDLQSEFDSLTLVAQHSLPLTSPIESSNKLRDIEQKLHEEGFSRLVLEHMRVRQKLTVNKVKDKVTQLTAESKLTNAKLSIAQVTLEEADLTKKDAKSKVKYMMDYLQEARLQRQKSLEDRLCEIYQQQEEASPFIRISEASQRSSNNLLRKKLIQMKARHQKLLQEEQDWK